MSEQNQRAATLAEVLKRYPHLDVEQLPAPGEPLERYAVVSSYTSESVNESGPYYWIALTNDAAALLKEAHADYYETGFLPLVAVDLDTEQTYDVDISFSLGGITQDSKLAIARV